MEGEEFLTINPESFSDPKYWHYKDLQKLCAKLQLGGRGSRNSLEEKLINWHRTRHNEQSSRSPNDSHFPMNVPGNNFSLLHINVKAAKNRTKKRRSSIHNLHEPNGALVDPLLLRPIVGDCNTPRKSILKKRRVGSPVRTVLPENGNDGLPTSTKLSKLQFSPFNGVKIISHRYSICSSPFDLCD